MNPSELIQLTHEHVNGYIKAADRKASIILGGQLAFGGLYFRFVSSVWPIPDLPTRSAVLITGGLSIASLIFSSIVVYPRRNERDNEGYIFWKNVNYFETKEDFVSDVSELTADEALEELSYEVYEVSAIAKKKYDFLRLTMVSTGLTVVMAVISLLLSLR